MKALSFTVFARNSEEIVVDFFHDFPVKGLRTGRFSCEHPKTPPGRPVVCVTATDPLTFAGVYVCWWSWSRSTVTCLPGGDESRPDGCVKNMSSLLKVRTTFGGTDDQKIT